MVVIYSNVCIKETIGVFHETDNDTPFILIVFQRYPAQRIRKPINRRIGNVIGSAPGQRRFSVKNFNKNVRPKPNLAKYPGNIEQNWLVKNTE